MRRLPLCLFLGAVALLFALSSHLAAATTEEVLAKIVKAEDELKSFECDMKSTLKIPGQERERAGHLAVEFLAKDGKSVVHRLYSKWEQHLGRETASQLSVYDGEFYWTETKTTEGDTVRVVKQKSGNFKDAEMASQMRKLFDLTLTAEDTFDGEKVWVLEGPLSEEGKKAPGRDRPEKARMLFSQKDGIARRMLFYDKDGKEMMDVQFSRVKVNQAIDPALFKYTPPEGAEVTDNTQPAPTNP